MSRPAADRNLWGTTAALRGARPPEAQASLPTVVPLRLLLLRAGVRAQELGEGPVLGQQLLVGAHLGDLAATHDDDDIRLRQVADTMGDQEPSLWETWGPGRSAHACEREWPYTWTAELLSEGKCMPGTVCGCFHSTHVPGPGVEAG